MTIDTLLHFPAQARRSFCALPPVNALKAQQGPGVSLMPVLNHVGEDTYMDMQGEVLLCWCAVGSVTANGSRAHASGLGFCTDSSLGAGEAFSQIEALAPEPRPPCLAAE